MIWIIKIDEIEGIGSVYSVYGEKLKDAGKAEARMTY